MSREELWLILIGGLLVTYATRLSFIAFLPPERMPGWFRRGLRYVPPAVLAALIAPELFFAGGALDLSFGNERLLAGLSAAFVAWRTKKIWLTIGTGMGVLWILTELGIG